MLSQEALLGQLIPDVYINGITLETSGEEPLVDNPHIDDERENAEKLNTQGRQRRPLRAIVDISIKEMLDNNLIGEWFREQGFQKYLKIAVFKTTSKNLISLFSENQYMINFVSEGSSVFGGGFNTLSVDEVQKLFEATGKSTQQEASEYLSQNFESRVLSASLDSLGGIDAVSSPTTVDADGNTIKDYIYRVVFEHPFQPSDFAVFAVSYLDLQAMKDDYDLDFEQGTLENQNGKVVSEIVIRDSQVVSESSVYLISEGPTSGQAWTGPIHNPTPTTYATGSEPSPASKKLRRRKIPNAKVQDFRQVDEIYEYQLPKEALRELGFEKRKIVLSNDVVHADENDIHFTNLWLSRDSNGTARFMFGVDIVSLIKHNSAYGDMLHNSEQMSTFVSEKTKIKNIKVLRKRVKSVKTLNKLGSPVQAEQVFDKKDPYTALIISGANASTLQEVTNTRASIRQSFPIISSAPEGMRYYTVQDKEMKRITDGLYQYGVEIEIEDGLVKHLEDNLSELVSMRASLVEYLTHASKTGMTKKILEINDPHIDDTRERRASSIKTRGYYDPITNRFTDKFLDFCSSKYSQDSYPWIESAIAYERAMTEVFGSNNMERFRILLSLSQIMSPHTGTPKGIMVVIDLYDKLISEYNRLVGKNVYAGVRTASSKSFFSSSYWFHNNLFDSNVTKMSGFDYLSDIADKEKSTTRYEDSMPLSEYADLAYGNRQSRGLKIIDGGYWQGRIKTETLKYFNDENPDLTIFSDTLTYTNSSLVGASSFGFLSPSYVVSSGQAYSLTLDRDYDYYSNINLGLLEDSVIPAPMLNNTSAQTNQSDQDKISQSKYESIFSGLNVTVQPLLSYESQLPYVLEKNISIESLDGCEDRQLDPVDPYPAWTESSDGSVSSIYSQEQDYKFGYANSNFVDFFRKTADFLLMGKGLTTTKNTAVDRTIKTYTLTEPANFLDTIQTNLQARNAIALSVGAPSGASASSVITSMPNQIKSLVLGTAASPVTRTVFDFSKDPVIDWQHSAKFILNYEFLASIERLEGFYDSSGTPSAVKSEKWVPLTEEYYLQSAGREILCRIKPFECEAIGNVRRDLLTAPVYDEYFVLLPPVQVDFQPLIANLYTESRAQLIASFQVGLEKISNFATTNLITGAF